MPITGNSFNGVSQFNNLDQVEIIREVVLPQDKVPKDDSFSGFIHEGTAPSFKIRAVNFKIDLFGCSWLLRFRRVI